MSHPTHSKMSPSDSQTSFSLSVDAVVIAVVPLGEGGVRRGYGEFIQVCLQDLFLVIAQSRNFQHILYLLVGSISNNFRGEVGIQPWILRKGSHVRVVQINFFPEFRS